MVEVPLFLGFAASLTIIGFTLLLWIFKGRLNELYYPEIMGVSYVIGTGFLGVMLYVAMLTGIVLSKGLLIGVIICSLVVLFILFRWYRPSLPRCYVTSLVMVPLVLVAGIILYGAISKGALGWDATDFWGLKAKILYTHGTFMGEDFTDPLRIHYHHRYPLLVPTIYSSAWFFIGDTREVFVLLTFGIFFIASWGVFYGLARRLCFSPAQAAIFTLVYAITPAFIHDAGGAISGYADLPFAVFMLVSIGYGYFSLHAKVPGFISLAMFGCAAAVITKNEGMAFFLSLLVSMMLFMRFRWKVLVIFLAPAFLAASWLISAHYLPPDPIFYQHLGLDSFIAGLPKLPEIFKHLGSEFLTLKHWGLLWPLFGLFLPLQIPRLREPSTFLVLVPAIQLLFYLGVYILFPERDVHTMMRFNDMRLLMHVFPSLLLWLCLVWTEQVHISKA
jgi:hypothetical protein